MSSTIRRTAASAVASVGIVAALGVAAAAPASASTKHKHPKPPVTKPTPSTTTPPTTAPTTTTTPAATTTPPTTPTTPPTGSASPQLKSVSVDASSVFGGRTFHETVTLDRPATGSGVTVELLDGFDWATVRNPLTAVVPAGSSSVTVQLTAPVLSAATAEDLTVIFPGVYSGAVRTQINVLPPPVTAATVASVKLAKDVIVNGDTENATVTLDRPAPAGGTTVIVSSNLGGGYGSDVAGAGYTPTQIVPAGATSVTFPVTVGTSADVDFQLLAHGYGDTTLVRSNVTQLVASSLAVGMTDASTGIVSIGSTPNPTGVTVALAASNTTVGVPATVFIPAGAISATFPVTGIAGPGPIGTANVTATWNGTTATSLFTKYDSY